MANNSNGKKRNGNANGKANGKNGNGNGGAKKKKQPRQRVTGPMGGAGIMLTSQNQRPLRQGVQTFSGSDFLGTVTVKASPSTSERILRMFPISPSFYPGTRITQLSQLWERYRFRSFRIRYVPAVPTTIACQFVLYLDTDPSDDPSQVIDSDVLVRQATAHAGSQQWNFNTPKVAPLPLRADDQLYYTGDTKLNERFNLMGKAYLVQITDPLNFNGDPVTNSLIAGSLYIDWTCSFQLAQINPAGYGLRGESVTYSLANTTVTTTPREITWSDLKPNKTYVYWHETLSGSTPTTFDASTTDKIYTYQISSLREDVKFQTNAATLFIGPPASTTATGAVRDIGTFQTDSYGVARLAIDVAVGSVSILGGWVLRARPI